MTWIPLESNPEVFNQWAQKAGLDISKDQICDLFSLDDESISEIPRPVKALILNFPWSESRQYRESLPTTNPESGPFWMQQTIRNACGTMAIIHALANADIALAPFSPLDAFYTQARAMGIPERSRLLENTPIFTEIHSSVANVGQCVLPESDEHPDQGYMALISYNGRIFEMDGGLAGPIDRGVCSDDFLIDAVKIVKEEFLHRSKSGSVKFCIMYLGRPLLS